MRLFYIAIILFSAHALADPELDAARKACERDLSACTRRDELEARARAEARARGDAINKMRDAEHARILAEQSREIKKADDQDLSARRRCGRRYGRVRAGMQLRDVIACNSGPVVLVGQSGSADIYEIPGGLLRVEHGRIVRWIAR